MTNILKQEHLDKPFSWIICLASCLNTLIIFGNVKSAGVFLVALHQTGTATRAHAAVITITTYGTFFALAVVGGALIHLFGYRPILISGSLIASSGTFCCYFVEDSSYYIFTFGFLQGAGLGLCVLPNASIVGYYFEKHRAKAFGFSFVGGPLGSLVFPPLCQLLIDTYLLKGSFLLLSAINLHIVVFSAIMKDPPESSKTLDATSKEGNSRIESYKISWKQDKVDDESTNTSELVLKVEKLSLNIFPNIRTSTPRHSKTSSIKSRNIEKDIEMFVKTQKSNEKISKEQYFEKSDESTVDSVNNCVENVTFASEENKIAAKCSVKEEFENNFDADNKDVDTTGPVRRFNSESFISKTSTLCNLIKIMLKDKFFYPVILTIFVNNFSLVFFNLTMPDFAVSQGSSPQAAAILISVASVFDILTRLTAGVLLDKKLVGLSFSWAVCLGLTAAPLFIAAGFGRNSYSILAFSSALYGFAFGVCQIHFPVCIMHFLGPRFLPLVMGSGAVLTAILTFNTAPLVTYFFSKYGSYAGIYYIGASMTLFCSITWFGIGFAIKM